MHKGLMSGTSWRRTNADARSLLLLERVSNFVYGIISRFFVSPFSFASLIKTQLLKTEFIVPQLTALDNMTELEQ